MGQLSLLAANILSLTNNPHSETISTSASLNVDTVQRQLNQVAILPTMAVIRFATTLTLLTLTNASLLPRQDVATCTVEGLQCLNLHYASADIGAVINCQSGKYEPTTVCDPESLCIDLPTPHCGLRNSTGVMIIVPFLAPSSTSSARVDKETEMRAE